MRILIVIVLLAASLSGQTYSVTPSSILVTAGNINCVMDAPQWPIARMSCGSGSAVVPGDPASGPVFSVPPMSGSVLGSFGKGSDMVTWSMISGDSGAFLYDVSANGLERKGTWTACGPDCVTAPPLPPTISLVTQGKAWTAGTGTAVISAGNTTGADVILVAVADYQRTSAADKVTDKFGNLYQPVGNCVSGSSNVGLWAARYAGPSTQLSVGDVPQPPGPIFTGPDHSIQISGNYISGIASAWKGTGILDVAPVCTGKLSSGAVSVGPSLPSADGEVVISIVANRAGSTAWQVAAPIAKLDEISYQGAVRMGLAFGYEIQSTLAERTSTWTGPVSTDVVGMQVVFGKPR